MILQRLAKAIAEQNWFTVVLEIIVVVVGIYLGLEATNWNQERDDRRAEVTYLGRISTDLESSLSSTNDTIRFQTRHAGYGASVLEALRNCDLAPERRDEFASGVYLVGKYAPASFVKATIQELLSAGRLTIIRNSRLRQTLVELLQYHDEHLFYMTDVQLRATRQVNYIDSVAPIVIDGPVGGGANVGWARLDADFDSLCADRRFHTAFASAVNYTWDSTNSLLDWAERLSEVKSQVDAELAQIRGQ